MITSVNAEESDQNSIYSQTKQDPPSSDCSLEIVNSIVDHPITYGISDQCDTLVMTDWTGSDGEEEWLWYEFLYEVTVERIILQTPAAS